MVGYLWHAHRSESTWYARASVRNGGKRKKIYMHRLIWGLQPGDHQQIDHIDHDGLNNTRKNTRKVTNRENMFNVIGAKGYYYDHNRKRNPYHAQIMTFGRQIFLGRYSTSEEARSAYLAAKQQYHQFATPKMEMRK